MTTDHLADVCWRFGPVLDHYLYGTDDGTGKPIDGAHLLWAIAGRESSFGANCKPRHEPAYDSGGKYASERHQAELLRVYGRDAACTYGPWQILPVNAPGFSPEELSRNPDHAAIAVIGFIRRRILEAQKARTLEQIADSYNSGNFRDANIPAEYIKAIKTNYFAVPMPQPAPDPCGAVSQCNG